MQKFAGRLGAGYVSPESAAALAAVPMLRERGDIERDEEVVVTRFDRGLAYVRLWEELTRPPASAPEMIFESQEQTKEGSV